MKNLILGTALTAFLLGVFETAVLSHIRFLPMLPDMVLILVIYIALYNGTAAGAVTGFSAGLIFDFLSLAPFGLHSFIFTLLGFLYGLLCGKYHIRRFFFPLILGFSATILKALCLFLLRFLFGQAIQVYDILSFVFWFETVFNACCTPLLFGLFGLFPAAFQTQEIRS
ncbi:MAG: rod shape-determining protein MreD [Treponema sp.]